MLCYSPFAVVTKFLEIERSEFPKGLKANNDKEKAFFFHSLFYLSIRSQAALR